MHGKEERFNFAVSINSPQVYIRIQDDWKRYGAEALNMWCMRRSRKRKKKIGNQKKIENIYNNWRDKMKDIIL
jgi:hypothetical protein